MKNQQKTNGGARCFHICTTCIDTYIVHYSQNTTKKRSDVQCKQRNNKPMRFILSDSKAVAQSEACYVLSKI